MHKLLKDHITMLRLMFDHCRQLHIFLKLKKCIFGTPFGAFLGHVVCKEGVFVDIENIIVIVNF